MKTVEALIIGGGLVGAAIGYGLAQRGLRAVILDEGDVAFRAARGNFGLVWVQGKGANATPYARWTQRSAALWPDFAAELAERTGIDVQLSQPGGLQLCLSEAEFEARRAKMAALAAQAGSSFEYEILGRNALARLVPGLGPEVVGGSWSPHDGHLDPLRLLRALLTAFQGEGGRLITGQRAKTIAADGAGFRIKTESTTFHAARLVLAAGLGNARLAPPLGLRQPVHPEKGQVLVTERVAPFLEMPTTHVRQTGDGTVLLGDSKEDAGFDVSSSPQILRKIADRARRSFPALAHVQIVRSWAALRVMTPDGLPVYDASTKHPGAFAAACHSGVTLAAVHAADLGRDIAAGSLSSALAGLGPARFERSEGGPGVQAA
ncbi:MAG: FAD-dependent oxidoreductase [Pseudomonadota bacterium]